MTLPAGVREATRVGGGDINAAFHVVLADGGEAFVKTRADAPAGEYAAEAAGLEWLAQPGAVRTPRVLKLDERYLALEWIEPSPSGRLDAAGAEELGRGLAATHAAGAPCFGLATGTATATGAGAGIGATPARLHGDLWSGNVLVDAAGRPWLIDPSAYGGHREVDLAMLRLFGAPSERVFAAYEELTPLADGWRERVDLYQLLALLVHALLFGGSYAGAVEQVARRYVR
jgi:fructosamine-3-kinase